MQTTNARRLRIMVASRAGRLRCVSAVNKVMLQPKQALLLFSAQAHRSTEGPLPPTFLVHYCPSTVLLPYCPTTLLHYCPTTRLRARVYILTIIVSLFYLLYYALQAPGGACLLLHYYHIILFIILHASGTRRCLFSMLAARCSGPLLGVVAQTNFVVVLLFAFEHYNTVHCSTITCTHLCLAIRSAWQKLVKL